MRDARGMRAAPRHAFGKNRLCGRGEDSPPPVGPQRRSVLVIVPATGAVYVAGFAMRGAVAVTLTVGVVVAVVATRPVHMAGVVRLDRDRKRLALP